MLLNLIANEYIAIVDRLIETEKTDKNRIHIEKERFNKILMQYPYVSVNHKIKVYKALNFIIHDEKSYTLPCRDSENKTTVRKVVFNYKTYKIIKDLLIKAD
jgi:hypothetical protein